MMTENEITEKVIGCAIAVHKALGPGLLESSYQRCLVYELRQKNLIVESQCELPLIYKDINLDFGYRLDLFVEKKVVIELKSIEALTDVHVAQMLTYLKLTSANIGLLINFNVRKLTDGVKRIAGRNYAMNE